MNNGNRSQVRASHQFCLTDCCCPKGKNNVNVQGRLQCPAALRWLPVAAGGGAGEGCLCRAPWAVWWLCREEGIGSKCSAACILLISSVACSLAKQDNNMISLQRQLHPTDKSLWLVRSEMKLEICISVSLPTVRWEQFGMTPNTCSNTVRRQEPQFSRDLRVP